MLELAGSPLLRGRLAAVALTAVRGRTWESALKRLAEGYRRVLDERERPDRLRPSLDSSRGVAGSPGARRAA